MNRSQSPVSPIELHPLPVTPVPNNSTQAHNGPINRPSTTFEKGSWLPFTLRWYYLVITTVLSLCFGSILVYLSTYSPQNHGLGQDNGSSIILFGWRFTPTLIAVLYAQMTVILFEDVKRTEPFTRLAKAPLGGACAYGTLLQTPRAWWSIFIDVCFRRKRTGHTSWSLVCTALINIIALLAISPLSAALLTSEEILVPKPIEFTRVIPKANTQIPMVPTRETYYRAMTAAMRNVSTSAWVTDNSLAFPFWPTSEAAQFGPNLASSYSTWDAETTTLQSRFQCQNMTLKSADIIRKRYSGVYVFQGYGPVSGTQPMAEFVLESGDGCRYELSIHPAVDLAAYGGMTWSDASTFIPTNPTTLPVGGRLFTSNMTSTDIWSRVNASDQCHGRDIVIINTPFTLELDSTAVKHGFIAENATYERSPDFRMRALLCDFDYVVSKHAMKATISGGSGTLLNPGDAAHQTYQSVPNNFINIPQFQAKSTQNEWLSYFDPRSLRTEADQAATSSATRLSGFSGMAPLLAVLSHFNLTSALDDPNIVPKIGSMKGRFFMEMLRDSFNDPRLVETDVIQGEATVFETRVVVLVEIGIALTALFFTSSILLLFVFWGSRLSRRPLNLRSDPASTIGLSLLFSQRLAQISTIRRMHDASRVEFYTALQGEKYFTSDDELIKGDNDTEPPMKVKPRRNWRPSVINVRMLVTLGLFLALVLVAVLTLNAFSARSQLSQLAFIYEANVSKLHLTFSTFAPISIAPTVISIAIGFWWDQLDSTFRILQPFISMSRGPTPMGAGAGLTYRSKSWAGAAIKAGHNKHWVLFMIAIGSVLAQVLTVSMSALFERESRSVIRQISVPRSLEIRQVPLITQVNLGGEDSNIDPAVQVLNNLYLDAPKNWLYGAGLQHSYNGSRLPWTAEGWSFLPIDVTSASNDDFIRTPSTKTSSNTTRFSANITISTTAIRARLDCSIVDETANVSSWIEPKQLSNQGDVYPDEEWAQINKTGKVNAYSLLSRIFAGTDSHTTMISRTKVATCCGNGTRVNPQRTVMGYWSPVYPPDSKPTQNDFPYRTLSWPMPITTKWLVGTAFNMSRGSTTRKHIYFTEVPRLQAARCKPIIETAEAVITLDKDTSNVISHSIQGTATSADGAWRDVFTQHEPDIGSGLNASASKPTNITASFGVLFLDSLLGSADRLVGGDTELVDENAFSFRDQNNGISMDLMTYSMYTLADKDPEALLNFTTLATYADRTFQAFFQHFVNSGLSLSKGGFAYQPIGDNSMDFIGRSLGVNNTIVPNKQFPILNTNRTATASISHHIRVLHMNTIATYLTTAILTWLIFTALLVTCLQRTYTSFMNRDVQLIADMLVLVAGSDNFLELVAEKGVDLKKNSDIDTMLGWFKDRDGQVRWGVEVVGGVNAVEWVDAPKQGFHVAPNKASWRLGKIW